MSQVGLYCFRAVGVLSTSTGREAVKVDGEKSGHDFIRVRVNYYE
jgi:hypothetical protein